MNPFTFLLRHVRAFLRTTIVLVLTFILVLLAGLLQIFQVPHPVIFGLFRVWRRLVLWTINLQITVEGPTPQRPGIVMPNHRSYADVLVIPTRFPIVFVSMAAVKKWPSIGWGAQALDTVFVDRSDPDSRRKTREQLDDRLQKGESVIIFPEGGTHRGPDIRELKPGMFHTVAQGNIPIHPVAIEFRDPGMAWVGKQSFFGHYWKNFGKARIEVAVRFGEELTGTEGEKLRNQMASWLTSQLAEMRQRWDQH
ncbi:MAG: lysophospholipid acyltransferase family protein [Salibacteraceae bacterium]|mgnify:CR=1 FL=1